MVCAPTWRVTTKPTASFAEEDPRFFRYLVAFADGGLMHEFSFVIDDYTSPDHLFIEDFEHDSRPV
jgi:hypothetical protein